MRERESEQFKVLSSSHLRTIHQPAGGGAAGSTVLNEGHIHTAAAQNTYI
jgi:hypothetical protein